MKNVKISDELHKRIKIYCAENNLKISEFIESVLKIKISNDNK